MKKVCSKLQKYGFQIAELILTLVGLCITCLIAHATLQIASESNVQAEKNMPLQYNVTLPQICSFKVRLDGSAEPMESDIAVTLQQGYMKDIVLIENGGSGIAVRTLDLTSTDIDRDSFTVRLCKMFSTELNEDGSCYNYCFFYIVGGDGSKHFDCAYIKLNYIEKALNIGDFQLLRKIGLLCDNDSQDVAIQELKENYKELLYKIEDLPASSFEN